MEKKPFLIAMLPENHARLKAYAKEAGTSIGDAVDLLLMHAEDRVELATKTNKLPLYDQLNPDFKSNNFLLSWVFLFNMQAREELHKLGTQKEYNQKIPLLYKLKRLLAA